MKKYTLHQLVWYFLIFSILGMIMENIVCFIGTGNIESRKGFIIGPFCPIYGAGAIFLLLFLDNKSKWYTKFFYGMILGSIFEYVSSFVMQAIYKIKFWDYSYHSFNINGRTALIYAFSWGILTIALIYIMKPLADKFIERYKSKSLDLIILFFMLTNGLATYKAINSYIYRAEGIIQNKNNSFDSKQSEFDKMMSNEVMKAVFPNIVYVTQDKNEILLRDIM